MSVARMQGNTAKVESFFKSSANILNICAA